MRQIFLEWHPIPDEVRDEVWKSGTFVLDTNVLLDLYRYPAESQAEFLAVLESLSSRLWLPHQVGLEYLTNREGIIPSLRTSLATLLAKVTKARDILQSLPLPENHPILSERELAEAAEQASSDLEPVFDVLYKAIEETESLVEGSDPDSDPIWERLSSVFEGRTGHPWPKDRRDEFVDEAAARFEAEVPPGFKDAKKDEISRYGDLLIWKQIIGAAESRPEGARSTVFVTNDRKEDWWDRKRGELRGPRRELIREYFEATGEHILMYTSSQFLSAAREILEAAVSGDAIAQVERLSAEVSVEELLWQRRMTLPPFGVRQQALFDLHFVIQDGKIREVRDLDAYTTAAAAASPRSSNVATPYFFSLVNSSYGPLIAEDDSGKRLGDRAVTLREDSRSLDGFLVRGHAAWLAQALFRIWHEDVSDDAILTAYFDEDDPNAVATLRRAKRFVAQNQGLQEVND